MDLYHIIAHAHALMKNCTTLVIKICFQFFGSAYISTIAYISTPQRHKAPRNLGNNSHSNRSTIHGEVAFSKKVYELNK